MSDIEVRRIAYALKGTICPYYGGCDAYPEKTICCYICVDSNKYGEGNCNGMCNLGDPENGTPCDDYFGILEDMSDKDTNRIVAGLKGILCPLTAACDENYCCYICHRSEVYMGATGPDKCPTRCSRGDSENMVPCNAYFTGLEEL